MKRKTNFEVLVNGMRYEFFSLAGARTFAKARPGATIFDRRTGKQLPVHVVPPEVMVRNVMLFNGLVSHAPAYIRPTIGEIRRRAAQISGKRTWCPPEALAQAKQEWLEKLAA